MQKWNTILIDLNRFGDERPLFAPSYRKRLHQPRQPQVRRLPPICTWLLGDCRRWRMEHRCIPQPNPSGPLLGRL
jgi:hypothetical protein